MQRKWLQYLAVPAMAGGLLLAADSQTSTPPQSAPAQQHRMNRGERLAHFLNLSEAQKEQAKAEFQAARDASEPIRQQLKQVRQEVFHAIKANDTAKIAQLSTQEGALRGQLLTVRNNAFARMYLTLTPEQRAKVDQLPAMFQQMKQYRSRAPQG